MNSTIFTFGHPETTIKIFKHWVLMIRLKQTTIGSLVVVARSEETNLGKLSEDEWRDFSIVTHELENMLRIAFGAEKFNYFALMMKDPHVHFHIIPRYSKPVIFDGKEYLDKDWPLKSELANLDISKKELTKIKDKLIASLKT